MGNYMRPVDVPDGLYAVEDPGGRMTFWSVRSGKVRDYPETTRWRPLPPPYTEGLGTEGYRQSRQEWYDTVYAEWVATVLAAIEDDPDGAAQRFEEEWGPHVELPEPKYSGRKIGRRRTPKPPRPIAESKQAAIEQQLLASAMKQAGRSYAEIGELLDLPKTTAWRRVTRQASTADDVVARALLLVRASELLTELRSGRIMAKASISTEVDPDRLSKWIAALEELVPRLRVDLDHSQGITLPPAGAFRLRLGDPS